MNSGKRVRTQVDLRFTKVADLLDRFGKLEAHMATVPGNVQYPSNKNVSQKNKKNDASRSSQYTVNDSDSVEEDRKASTVEN